MWSSQLLSTNRKVPRDYLSDSAPHQCLPSPKPLFILFYLKKQNQTKVKTQRHLEPVWYVCLKIENYCLKIFVKICVGKKIR